MNKFMQRLLDSDHLILDGFSGKRYIVADIRIKLETRDDEPTGCLFVNGSVQAINGEPELTGSYSLVFKVHESVPPQHLEERLEELGVQFRIRQTDGERFNHSPSINDSRLSGREAFDNMKPNDRVMEDLWERLLDWARATAGQEPTAADYDETPEEYEEVEEPNF